MFPPKSFCYSPSVPRTQPNRSITKSTMTRPLNEQYGISVAALQMLNYLQQIARGDRAFTLRDITLNTRCNVTPPDNFALLDQLFEAGKIDYDYRGTGIESERHVKLVRGAK